jgi:hypothetical protein
MFFRDCPPTLRREKGRRGEGEKGRRGEEEQGRRRG